MSSSKATQASSSLRCLRRHLRTAAPLDPVRVSGPHGGSSEDEAHAVDAVPLSTGVTPLLARSQLSEAIVRDVSFPRTSDVQGQSHLSKPILPPSRIPVARSSSVVVTLSNRPVPAALAVDAPQQELPAQAATPPMPPCEPPLTPIPPPTASAAPMLAMQPTVGSDSPGGPKDPADGMDESTLAEAAASTAQVLRVDLSDHTCYETAWASLTAGEAVLAHLTEAAKASGQSEAGVWRDLLAQGPGHSTAGSALVPRTPPHATSHYPQHEHTVLRKAELAKAAALLRGLLRLSICDDADLRLAHQVVAESLSFLGALRAASEARDVPPSQLWYALNALES